MKIKGRILLIFIGLVFLKADILAASLDFKQDYFREPEAIDAYRFNGSNDNNNDGKPDAVSYCNEKTELFIEDTDFDGRINRISYFENGELIKIEEDVDQDGEWDHVYSWDVKEPDRLAGSKIFP